MIAGHALRRLLQWAVVLGFLAVPIAGVGDDGAVAADRVFFTRSGFAASDIALIINAADPYSVGVGDYYQRRRGIPEQNVVRVRFPADSAQLSRSDLERLKAEVDARLPAGVQGYALAWVTHYRVECMGITTAFAFGFDEAFCSKQCGATRASPYFDSTSLEPARDHGLRPAMLLAARDVAQAQALIDRGLAAHGSMPGGTAYLLRTSDRARSTRAGGFEETAKRLGSAFRIEVLDADSIRDRDDVLFYFTGQARVNGLETLRFLPGALADHLTSFGGMLTDSTQMSALAWLEAGASASYGTVVEPCSHPQKFPVPAVAMFHYGSGATAIEAYWKSVAWPGEGVFVGDPLSRPFAPSVRALGGGEFAVTVHLPVARPLIVEAAQSPVGPFGKFRQTRALPSGRTTLRLRLPVTPGYYRIR